MMTQQLATTSNNCLSQQMGSQDQTAHQVVQALMVPRVMLALLDQRAHQEDLDFLAKWVQMAHQVQMEHPALQEQEDPQESQDNQ